MFLKTNLGYLSQIALKNMQLLVLMAWVFLFYTGVLRTEDENCIGILIYTDVIRKEKACYRNNNMGIVILHRCYSKRRRELPG